MIKKLQVLVNRQSITRNSDYQQYQQLKSPQNTIMNAGCTIKLAKLYIIFHYIRKKGFVKDSMLK